MRHIGSFNGRVFRFLPDSDHCDAWHGDNADTRLVALSLNLSPRAYEGGVLELRRRGEEKPFQRAVNSVFGDAIIFRLDAGLVHRVTDVTGAEPKTAFAGERGSPAPPSYRVQDGGVQSQAEN